MFAMNHRALRRTAIASAIGLSALLGLSACNSESTDTVDTPAPVETDATERIIESAPETSAAPETTEQTPEDVPETNADPAPAPPANPYAEKFDGWSWPAIGVGALGIQNRTGFSGESPAAHLSNSDEIGPGVGYTVTAADGSRSSCSFGWLVQDGDTRLMTTAAHCGNVGDKVSVFDSADVEHEVGEFIWSNLGDNSALGWDHALIRLNGDVRNVTGVPNIEGVRVGHAVDRDAVVDASPYMCTLSYVSGVSCGSFTEDVTDLTGRANFPSVGGDSGGAVFVLNPHTGKLQVVGSLNGSWNGAEDTDSRIKYLAPMLDETGVELRS